MKASTRQRFAALEFDYPDTDTEVAIVAQEAGIDAVLARQLVTVAQCTRALKQRGLDEGASTRVLVYAGILVRDGLTPAQSCEMTLVRALPDDPDMAKAIRDFVQAQFG
jgi:nitric oxide reductase NorQ protein